MGKGLVVRGRIWTGSRSAPFAEAFLVRDGIFVAVGDFCDVREQAAARDIEFIDAGDNLIIPGMTDSHIHLTAQAKQGLYVNLAHSVSLGRALEKIKERSTELPEGAWVRAINYNEDAWSKAMGPTRQLLDALELDNPLVLSRYCGHVHVANTKALMASGLWASSDPNVVRDGQGDPTGVLNEGAAGSVISEIAGVYETPERLRKLIGETCRKLSAMGVTAVHACDAPSYALAEDLGAFQVLEEEGQLPLRVTSYHDVLPNYSFQSGFGSPYVRFGGLKVFCDGSIGGRTAALSAPFSDDPTTSGKLNHDDEELYVLLSSAQKRDIQVQIHVIGDRAIGQALRVIERVVSEEGEPKRPYRLNHLTYCPPSMISKMKNLGIVADAQPVQAYRNRFMAPARLGKERLPFTYAYRKFVDAGIPVTGSSDGPIEDINPWAGIWAAVTRADEYGTHLPYSSSGDGLTLDEALRIYTTNPWEAVGRGRELGKISPGFIADFTILDGNPFNFPEQELRNVRHRSTFLAGKCVWRESQQ